MDNMEKTNAVSPVVRCGLVGIFITTGQAETDTAIQKK